MAEIDDWDVAAANNNSSPPNGWPEGMNYSAVNNTGREGMAVLARWYLDTNGSLISGGSANAQTLTANRGVSAYGDGLELCFRAGFTNTAATTLNVNAVGASAIVNADGSALSAGQLTAGGLYRVIYSTAANKFILMTLGAGGFPAIVAPSATIAGDVTATGAISGASVAGDMRATQAQAEAGTATDKLMTPERVAQAIAALSVFTKAFESAELSISASGSHTVAHGLGVKPKFVQTFLVCKTAEHGYAVNEETPVVNSGYHRAGSGGRNQQITYNTTNLQIDMGNSGTPYYINSSNTGDIAALTNSRWRLIVRAWA